MTTSLIRALFVLWLAACATGFGQQPTGPARWESQIAAFEEQDRQHAPPPNAVLFVGSSSIRMWDVQRFFPGVPVINRGFGGSEYSDVVHFLSRLVKPYQPATLVLYSGDNDISKGKTPQQVAADVGKVIESVLSELPATRIVVIGIKPSIARWKLIEPIRETNRLLRELVESDGRLRYVDVEPAMLDSAGQPRKELFLKDGLHLNDEGYAIWTSLVEQQLTWGSVATDQNSGPSGVRCRRLLRWRR